MIFSKNKLPPIDIKRECYAISNLDDKTVEIEMYGQIVEKRPVDWWTGEPKEGNFIIKSEFLEDLQQLTEAKRIFIRLDSIGGDAYASLLIYNRLRELKANITVQVDGVAMSGGSIIMCAGDTIKVNPASIIMIHKSLALLIGWYNADELDKVKQSNVTVDKALAGIYVKRTGLSEEEVLEIMADETYFTGEEAVNIGLADTLLEGEKAPTIAASADYNTLFVNGRAFATLGYALPKSLPIAKAAEAPPTKKEKGGNKKMDMTFAEFRAENPSLAEELMAEATKIARAEISAETDTAVAEAIKAERERMSQIDSIAVLYDDELVNEAKYGENSCTAQELAFRAAQEATKKGDNFLKDLKDGYEISNLDKVNAADMGNESPGEPLSNEDKIAKGREIAKRAKQNK